MTGEIIRYLSSTVGAVLLIAAAAKLTDGGGFAAYLEQSAAPAALVAPLAFAVPATEALIGVLLVVGLALPAVAIVAAVLAATFLAVQVREVAHRGVRGGCRCFGALDAGEPTVVPLVRAVAVLAGAVALAGLVYLGPEPVGAFTGDDHIAATVVGALSGAAVVAAFTVAAETTTFERRRRAGAMA